MSTHLRSTPAMTDVLRELLSAQGEVWGLRLSAATGRPTGTVYPILERLERAGMVVSGWEAANDRPGPRRRLYALTGPGAQWAQERCAGAEARSQHAPSRTALA